MFLTTFNNDKKVLNEETLIHNCILLYITLFRVQFGKVPKHGRMKFGLEKREAPQSLNQIVSAIGTMHGII